MILLTGVVCALAGGGERLRAAQDANVRVEDAVGCYELVSIDWGSALATVPESARRLYTPPRFFALTATQTSGSYRRVLSRYPKDPQRLAHGGWMLTGAQEITLMFPHTGFESLLLVVSPQNGQRLSGRAWVITDTGARPAKANVIIARVACWEN